MLREEPNRPGAQGAVTRCHVGEVRPQQLRQQPSERGHREPPCRAHRVGVVPGKTGADDDVVVRERGDQVRDVAWVVLPVTIDLDHHVVPVLQGVGVAGPHGAADAQSERQSKDCGTRPQCHLARGVARVVVDDQDVYVGRGEVNVTNDGGHRLHFVECRDDHKNGTVLRSHAVSPLTVPSYAR